MINKLQKMFNTEKRSGRTFFIISLYLFYFILFYIISPLLFFLPLQSSSMGGIVLIIIIFIIPPILSFKIPSYIKRVSQYKHLYLYHTIFVVLLPFLYIFLWYIYLINNIEFSF